MSIDNSKLTELIKDTIYCFISPDIQVLGIENIPVGAGSQAVGLSRHKINWKMTAENETGPTGTATTISLEVPGIYLYSKQATFIERSALSRLYSQAANVPYSLSNHPLNEGRSLLVIQDVDVDTDYAKLDIAPIQDREMLALAYIHRANMGCREDLPWLPMVDEAYIAEIINEKWRYSWNFAKDNPAFERTFGLNVISGIEEAADGIVEEMSAVINDASTHTMIHNDLNPGNVLVHNNENVYFIDWEEARYGSLFMDIPMRCGSLQQASAYRTYLGNFGLDIPEPRYAKLFSIASRYLGLRFMCWNLGVWEHNEQAKADLLKYMKMVTQPLFSS
ncbi:hypothetical protein H70357_04980 [Paenibacillus sp. FSL H7-0357]|uniref:phosphotransferase n=1 Tax=Paenibacillus sp. FSL H7-0357 TaxID=1536774 RepID=UPI0004F843A4|nr:phosphotransferase [Paenibacillus sp. FSL H7-0357]AIQ16105.1 hypothetical protein H70357_04980 [Paenibacillus sp. FSL H7-0357]